MREQTIDRFTIRQRPSGLPVMHQSWNKLLFMHWKFPPEVLRPFIPERLEVDTFRGDAWIGLTPFVVRGTRPVFFPPIPWLGDFNEVNVRTYVHYQGVPGVWFFSLDADSIMAVSGASAVYHLPYHRATMSFREDGEQMYYHSKRREAAGSVELDASWIKGAEIGEAAADTLEFFLTERYCLYAVDGAALYRGRIHHQPWKLRKAQLTGYRSTMLKGQGLPSPEGEPLLHYSESQPTSIWPLQRVS